MLQSEHVELRTAAQWQVAPLLALRHISRGTAHGSYLGGLRAVELGMVFPPRPQAESHDTVPQVLGECANSEEARRQRGVLQFMDGTGAALLIRKLFDCLNVPLIGNG